MLTVVLKSYLRSEFIREAFDSILDQQTALEYEVIILTALESPWFSRDFKERADRHGISLRLLKTPLGPMGIALTYAFREARGDLVAFIDDDDLWEPGKLRSLESALEEVPELAFYHNGQVFVDARNRPLSWMNFHRLVRHPSTRLPEGRTLVLRSSDPATVINGFALEPHFNCSSIVVRRSVMMTKLEALAPLKGGDDTLYYFAALCSGRPLYLVTDRLTRYRVHSRGTTAAGAPDSTFPKEVQQFSALVSGHLKGYRIFRGSVAEQVPPVVRSQFDSDETFWRVMGIISRVECTERFHWGDLVLLLRNAGGGGSPRNISAAALGILSSVWPALAQALLVSSRRVW